jgi:hypothetical protein
MIGPYVTSFLSQLPYNQLMYKLILTLTTQGICAYYRQKELKSWCPNDI